MSGFPALPRVLIDDIEAETVEAPPFRFLCSIEGIPSLRQFISSLRKNDIWIARLSGDDPWSLMLNLRRAGMEKGYLCRDFKSYFWSMDNHQQEEIESSAQWIWDGAFLAHSSWMRKFNLENAFHIPCAYTLSTPSDLIQIMQRHEDVQQAWSLSMPFTLYPGEQRNEVALWLRGEALERSLPAFIGSVSDPGEFPRLGYILHLLSTKVVVNCSLRGDLNMRAMEALALNRILLTDAPVDDLALLEKYGANIVKFDRQSKKDFSQKVIEALDRNPEDISVEFAAENSIESRLRSMLETIFGGSLVEVIELTPSPSLQISSSSFRVLSLSSETAATPYTNVEIIGHMSLRGVVGSLVARRALLQNPQLVLKLSYNLFRSWTRSQLVKAPRLYRLIRPFASSKL